MKSLHDFLAESELENNTPRIGDAFDIELTQDHLIESVIVGINEDEIIINADETAFRLLEGRGMLSESVRRYGAVGNSPGMGHTLAERTVEEDCGCESESYTDEEPTADPGEYDHEGDMAKNELHTIIRAARKLTGMLDDEANMPEWTQKKINKAADYVDTAADYISSQKERGVMEQDVAEEFDVEAARERLASLKRELKSVTGNYPGDQRNRMLFRRQIFDLKAQIKAAGGKKSGVAEGSEDVSPVARAVLHRIMMAHPGVLAQHGPERVMSAVDELADRVNIGPDDEIGTSDVSGWVRDVIRMLSELPDESMSDVDRLGEGEANTTDPLANKAAALAPVSAQGDQDPVTTVDEAEYQGRKVQLGKPTRGDVKKFKVYVRDPKTGNVKKVNFGDPNMRIKKSNPARRKSFRARHNCDNPGPRTKARYWSCRKW